MSNFEDMKFDFNFFITLLSIINPLGTIPIFIALTKNQPANRRLIAAKGSIYSTIILVSFFYFGPYVLKFFNISITGLKLAGGIVVAISGYAMIESKLEKHKGIKKKTIVLEDSSQDPSLVPLAMPMLAGPGSISFLIGENFKIEQSFYSFASILISILLCGIVIFITFITSNFISKHISEVGIKALSRFIGFFIMAIGIEMVLSAFKEIIA